MDWEHSLRAFFAGNLAKQAGSYLAADARIAIHIGRQHEFLFLRKGGKNRLEVAVDPEADVHFWLSVSTLRHLLQKSEQENIGMGALGVAVIECLFEKDTPRKVKVRVKAPFLSLWRKGYFSVLKAGGPEVASYLARWGYDSFARWKDMLRHFRG